MIQPVQQRLLLDTVRRFIRDACRPLEDEVETTGVLRDDGGSWWLDAGEPGAEIVPSTFDLFAARLAAVAEENLPVVTSEIGDTWLHGIASDPSKTAAFRETCRRRRSWIDSGAVAADDPALWSASTELLLVAEHTWGLDQKTHWPDTDHWSESALASVRPRPATRR